MQHLAFWQSSRLTPPDIQRVHTGKHYRIFESVSHLEESPEVCRGMLLVLCQIMCFCLWLSYTD